MITIAEMDKYALQTIGSTDEEIDALLKNLTPSECVHVGARLLYHQICVNNGAMSALQVPKTSH